MYKNEILAPAGSYETFISVINAGADAVYLAGNMFGARAYANNLTDEELLQAIDYAHIHGKKLYLTVNTLLKNNEIYSQLFNYIEPLYKAGLDAVIVQDYGVLKFLSDNFPQLDIHASTQMTITDGKYTEFLKKVSSNVTRIVPARELSLEELKKLHNETDLEIEAFVHGALCYCYSGQCFMSSFFGGRSGNRGRCAGPCRLLYSKDGQRRSLLSLKDLCTLDIIPEIIKAGVYSFKIEGRMKSTEYAAGVTSIYRKYVDIFLQEGEEKYKVDKKDIQKLLMLFDRGGMSTGYYNCHNGKNMLAEEIKSDKSQQEKNSYEKLIKKTYSNNIKEKINIDVKLLKNMPANIIFTLPAKNISVSTEGNMVVTAINNPMTRQDISKQIGKLGNTSFICDNINIEMDEDIYISNKDLNELRRNAVYMLENEVLKSYRRCTTEQKKYKFNYDKIPYRGLSVHAYSEEQIKTAIKYKPYRIIIEADLLSENEIIKLTDDIKKSDILFGLAMPRIGEPRNLNLYLMADYVLVRNISQCILLKKHNYSGKIIADYNVYTFNDISAYVLKENGFDEITCSVELGDKELAHIKTDIKELPVYGKIPLMISAGCIDLNTGKCHKNHPAFSYITDRKNAQMPYLASCKYCYNIIFNSIPLYLIDKVEQINDILPVYEGIYFTDETKEQTEEIMNKFINRDKMPDMCTRGHFTKGAI